MDRKVCWKRLYQFLELVEVHRDVEAFTDQPPDGHGVVRAIFVSVVLNDFLDVHMFTWYLQRARESDKNNEGEPTCLRAHEGNGNMMAQARWKHGDTY